MIANQPGKCRGRLIVGGVRFVNEPRLALDPARELAGLGGVVVDDLVVVEFDARLHDQCHCAFPGRTETERHEGVTVGVERHSDRARRGHRQGTQFLGGTSGCRDLRADHVEGCFAAGLAPCTLGGVAQPRRALRDDGVRQRAGIVGTGHRAVEMDLPKAG